MANLTPFPLLLPVLWPLSLLVNMETEYKGKALLLCFLLVGLASEAVAEGGLAEQKNYYPPDPHRHSHKNPCPTPSHGGGASSHKPPTPSGGGGYYNPPSGPVITAPPTPIIGPITPSPLVPPTPILPVILTPPATPLDPNSPPFTCDYWRTHPAAIWGMFGYWGTIGQFFGAAAASAFGSNLSLPQALANTRTDGIGALYREGTAALLNSMVNRNFVLTTQEVKDAFAAAVIPNNDAMSQAQIFKKANEGRLKHY